MKRSALLLLLGALPVLPLIDWLPATLPTVNLYTVADGGGSDTNDCSRTKPCATIERTCERIPDDVAQPYIIHVGAGTYSAGCHLVGKRQVRTADWTSPGSILLQGAQKRYPPTDGGSGTALLGWVAAGSNATRDEWGFDGGTFSVDELKGKWVQVETGTGADDTKRWLVTTNDGDSMTVEAVSTGIGPATAPAAGSAVGFYQSDTTINGNLSDTVTPVGFPQSTAVSAAFVIGGNVGGYNTERLTRPFIGIERVKFGSSASRGVLLGDGPLAVRESECATTTSSCVRGSDGVSSLVFERNLLTGSSSVVVMGNTALGSLAPSVQVYNNFSNGTVGNLFSAGQVGVLASGMNTVTCSGECFRINRLDDGYSKWDKLTSAASCYRAPLMVGASGYSAGTRMDFTGLSCTSSAAYSFTLSGRDSVYLDSTSTVVSDNHHAAVANGAQLWWASGATWTADGGADDFAFTATGGTLTEAGVTAGGTEKNVCNEKGTCVGIPTHSGANYAAVVAPAGTTSGADGQLQLCAGTASAWDGGSGVVFASAARCAAFSAAPVCWCNEMGDGGTNVPCAPTGTSTTAASFVGDSARGTSTVSWGCVGPK